MNIPEIRGTLRNHFIELPACVGEASGIRIFGKLLRSLVFTTDVAIMRNTNADAVIAVYPFTPMPAITHALLTAADLPVFCGVGGGTTRGARVADLARDAEFQGAIGVVVNAPTEDETIRRMAALLDIPIVITVVSEKTDIAARLAAGASILNVSGAARTPEIVRGIRERFPQVPIIATGGPTEASMRATIEAGANAVTYTPPTTAELFRTIMVRYRDAEI